MDTQDYPLLEFDPAREALLEPSKLLKPHDQMPQRAVLCFFNEVITTLAERDGWRTLGYLASEMGKAPIYLMEAPDGGPPIAVMQAGVGAPLAAGFMEELIAFGVRSFVACGGAGVLNREIAMGHLIVAERAVRDEGTSYHYLPPSREVAADPVAVDAICAALDARDIPYTRGKTWTTDGIYRETPARVARRRDEGCITVEMEAAAFFAVAQFRRVRLGLLLYGGDDVSGDVWDHRGWSHAVSTRERLFWLAVEAAARLPDTPA